MRSVSITHLGSNINRVISMYKAFIRPTMEYALEIYIPSASLGGTPHKPYPKHVWSPSGGWWSQPKQWKRNTLIVGLGTSLVLAFIFKKSAELEQRTLYPRVWIPSMIWSKQFKTKDDPNFQPPKSL
ncbi:hypothetical protein H4R27_003577 [Coemansia aciculifera]|nr:hypothetical protein H4R27_003577 [Coemansia aciculifera]